MKWKPYIVPPLILQSLAWAPTRLLLMYFCHFEVHGQENLKGLRQVIFACNHSNELDPIVLTAALHPLGRFSPLFYISGTIKSFDDGSFGWRRHLYSSKYFFAAWGAYPHSPGQKNYENSLSRHLQILKDGGSLCIFPEGKLTKDGTIQPAHGGVSYLSHASGVPIVPVALVGLFGMDSQKFLSKKVRVKVVFEKPVLANNIDRQLSTIPKYYVQRAQEILSKIEPQLR